ncbi:MAG: anti-sigma regulatory factor [Myxococcales bacterium]|nr:anti-sigma regulatory factor [Myxococcales bacterium]
MATEAVISIERETDIVTARQKGRELAAAFGFSSTEQTLIALAISELARNALQYAKKGEIVLSSLTGDRRGIEVVARDDGPGIPDVELALQDGYSTGRSLGLGLPGARRVMDEFHIDSAPGRGTTVTVRKWLR